MRKFQIALTRDPLSLAGSALATVSALLILTLFILQLFGLQGGPYIGILAYLILPTVLAIGLVLIPIGIRRARRKGHRGESATFPVIDLNVDRTRRIVLVVLALTAINVIVLSTATYKGVQVMESTEFCGTACHSVMAPEHTAYLDSPHSSVACVECHIGSGADWFARSKLAGAWQVVSATFNLYTRPIGTPVHGMRPASETCGECHSPDHFVGNTLEVITRFGDDEESTRTETALLMRVGGRWGDSFRGIHWHADPEVEIRYRSDPARETIYDVEVRRADGTAATYLHPDQLEEGWEEDGLEFEWRTMDCTDCHNRPAHRFALVTEAVDAALEEGRLPTLPYLKREAVAALERDLEAYDEAEAGIADDLEAFYRDLYQELYVERADEVHVAAAELSQIYRRNVFPGMEVDWRTYPDHIGHEEWPGCYRCHDDEHETADGEYLSQECEVCHAILAWDEEEPEILEALEYHGE